MRILCIKLEINQGCTTMHGQPIIKIHITKTIVGEDGDSGEKPGGGGGNHDGKRILVIQTTEFSIFTSYIKQTPLDLRTAIFWAITQRAVVVPYRRLGTTYRSHLKKGQTPSKTGPVGCP